MSLWLSLLVTVSMAAPTPQAQSFSVHAEQAAQYGGVDAVRAGRPRPAPLPPPTRGPDHVVYGYLAYWDDDLNQVPWDELSHIAMFSANVNTSGGLTSTSNWSQTADAVAIAGAYGVKVHLCITNFNTSELGTLLGSASARSATIQNLRQWVDQTGADGVNIDFEGVPASARANFVTFVRDLHTEFGDEVVLATPAVDWSDAYDYAALSQYADLFIMGYAYHYSGSQSAGPNDPLYGASPWSVYSLDWTVKDYRSNGADLNRVILGLPLYGMSWSTASDAVPSNSLGFRENLFWSSAQSKAAQYGRRWDAPSHTPYYYDGAGQGWYCDVDSISERIDYALDEGLSGVGFWALNYDDNDGALWAAVAERTTDTVIEEPVDTSGPVDTDDTDVGNPKPAKVVANAGPSRLAYLGDTVVIDGSASTGPEAMIYQWKQKDGAPVVLNGAETSMPSVTVNVPGTLRFSLVVEALGETSKTDDMVIVVLDPKAGRRLTGGCDTLGGGGAAGGAAFALLLTLGLRRGRRTSSR